MSDTTSDPLIDALFGTSQQFGRYTLAHRVAQGGMASVYLAQLAATDGFQKWFALKVIHPHLAGNPKFERMFAREAQLASRMTHPNVCSVVDFGQHAGSYYLVMEYLHGESLGAVQHRAGNRAAAGGAGVPLEIAARIVADAARGLHAAHELRNADGSDARVVHRDVSPSNVFVLYDGVSKVVDFGIAHFRESTDERTATEELRGKIAYMAPEQLARKPVDRRTDVWALGVVLWEVTLGRRLFKRDSEIDTIVAVGTAAIPRPSRVRKGYPAELEKIVMRALERDVNQRTATAGEVADALERWISRRGEPVGTPQVAAFMRELFGDRITTREEILRRGGAGLAPGAEVEWTDASLGGERGAANEPLPPDEMTATRAETPRARRRRSRAAYYAAAGLVTAAGLAAAVPATRAWRGRSGGADRAVAAPASATSAVRAAGATASSSPVAAPPAFARDATPVERAVEAAPPAAPGATPAAAVASSTRPAALAGPPARATRVVRASSQRAAAHAGMVAAARGATTTSSSAGTTAPQPATTNAAANGGTNIVSSGAPASSVQRGFLNLMAQPAAEVFEGSIHLGHTPFARRPIAPGHHSLRLVPISGGQPERTVEVDVLPGQLTAQAVRWP